MREFEHPLMVCQELVDHSIVWSGTMLVSIPSHFVPKFEMDHEH
jgi:hypothetical protein